MGIGFKGLGINPKVGIATLYDNRWAREQDGLTIPN